ncbi:hypothetical protein CSOJ01_13126 [Colletotrichum sojae]|uniref:DUF6536 domain-containing protein n=1 Tax=Colletotrichum sojae TaxID=2175907 RepID=A0A8H6MLJ5_9PEZI|nr:hypothetical protein CSOJ01_13126 [Colletotrichum sojae]
MFPPPDSIMYFPWSTSSAVPRWVHSSSWRQAAFYFSIAAFSTFLVNLIFVLWAIIQKRDTFENGVGTLLDRDCSTIKLLNTAIHVLINILSIVLLAGSNYCMQCLMAPTRPEIDDAQARQQWLDIGVPSVRNFRSMTWKKKIVWALLSFSSIPLHLVSVNHCSASVNNYRVLSPNALMAKNQTGSRVSGAQWKSMYASFLGDDVEQLDVRACIDAYGVAFQSSRGNLLLVSNDARAENSTTEVFNVSGIPFVWIQKTDEHCKLFFSSTLCWVVAAFILLKAVLMLFVAFGMGDEDPLMTIGDVVASFLERQDEPTSDMCLKSKDHFVAQYWSKGPIPYDLKPQRKYFGLIMACAFLFTGGLYQMSGSGNIITLGLGAVQTKTILNTGALGQGSILANILLVNTPQMVLSLIYFTYNTQCTSISIITEWDRFSNEAKSLRVSTTPEGTQRDTYFLQLPYRYSLPILIFSGGLHWLISQTFFLVNLEVYAPSDNATSMERVMHEGSGVGVIACG